MMAEESGGLIMKKRVAVLGVLAVIGLLASLIPAAIAQGADADGAGEAQVIPGRVGVLFKDSVTDPRATANEMARQHGFQVAHVFTAALKGFAGKGVPEGRIRALERDPRVRLVALDRTVHPRSHPGDTNIARIHAGLGVPDNRGDGVDIVVMDTGVGPPDDLVPILSDRSLNFVTTEDVVENGTDLVGHGTAVAGVIGGKAIPLDVDVLGVASDATLWSFRVLGPNSSSFLDAIAAVDYVASLRDGVSPVIEVVNMSFGAACSRCGDGLDDDTFAIIKLFHMAIINARALGTTFVGATSNDGVDASFDTPTSFEEVIGVSMMFDSDGKPGGLGGRFIFPGLGPVEDDSFVKGTKISGFGADIDFIAPGWSVLTLDKDEGTRFSSGTSFAAPHVSAVAAIFISQHLNAETSVRPTPAQVHQGLINSAELAPDGGWPTDPDDFGEPLVNARRASLVPIPTVFPAFPAELNVDASVSESPITSGAASITLTAVVTENGTDDRTGLPPEAFNTHIVRCEPDCTEQDGVVLTDLFDPADYDTVTFNENETSPGTYTGTLDTSGTALSAVAEYRVAIIVTGSTGVGITRFTVTAAAPGPDGTGPTTSAVSASPNPTAGAASVTLTATVDDSGSGGSDIVKAEYFIDDDTADDESGIAMIGTFDSVTEDVTASVIVSGLSLGSHTVFVHGKDVAGNWGAFSSVVLVVSLALEGVTVTSIEPGFINIASDGTSISVIIAGFGFVDGADVTFENGKGPAPKASNITVDNANTITATVTVKSNGPSGSNKFDVRVTNPDNATDVKTQAFEVIR